MFAELEAVVAGLHRKYPCLTVFGFLSKFQYVAYITQVDHLSIAYDSNFSMPGSLSSTAKFRCFLAPFGDRESLHLAIHEWLSTSWQGFSCSARLVETSPKNFCSTSTYVEAPSPRIWYRLMDLEEFNNINELTTSLTTTIYSAEQALEYLDAIWYTNTNRRGRWMDLIGDYAGSELFILDGTHFYFYHPSYLMPNTIGESLLQLVLDDSLLALARPDG